MGLHDSSETYCLSDVGGLHSNLKKLDEKNIPNSNIIKITIQVLYIIRKSISLAL